MRYENPGNYPNQLSQAGQVIANSIDPKPANIGDELSANDKRLQELHGAINSLEQRLCAVLRPTGPATSGTGDQPPMPWSAVVCALKNAGFQTEAAIARIQDILNRLDV